MLAQVILSQQKGQVGPSFLQFPSASPRYPERVKLIEASSFVGKGLLGNPAGVCILKAEPESDAMQATAAEVGHAETAFLWPEGDGWRLRWFTPEVEVDLCGHATLAAAWVLSREVRAHGRVKFHTRSGVLTADLLDSSEVRLDFPALIPVESSLPESLSEAAALAVWTGQSRDDWFAALSSAREVREFCPDMERIGRAGKRGLIITAPGEEGWDVISRFFAPQCGVPEDHVTGSAHCAIAPYWRPKGGRLRCLQASPRGGELLVDYQGDRVRLTGKVEELRQG